MKIIDNLGVRKNLLLLKGYAPAVRKELSDIAYQRMAAVFDVSQELVPVRTGHLKESGGVFQTATGAGVRYTAPYAKRIEYDANLHHENGQAFFVGQPFTEEKQRILVEFGEAAVKPLKKNNAA